MKIRAIAIAPHDGWAFIVKEKKIFLLRPPFVCSNQKEVPLEVVENATNIHGFDECDITFDSMNEVIRFLKDQYIRSKKDQGIDVPTSEELRELLKYLDDDVLLKYLRRAQNKLISEGNLDAAESVALEILKLERVKNCPEIQKMAIEIIERCKKERNRLAGLEVEILNNLEETWKDRFPRALKEYAVDLIAKHRKSIQKRGQLLPVGKAGV
jgi:hypothetical protein